MPFNIDTFGLQNMHYWLLILSILSLWFTPFPRSWAILFSLSLLTGLVNGGISFAGAGVIIAFGFSCYLLGGGILNLATINNGAVRKKLLVKTTIHLCFLTLGTIIATGIVPGIDNLRLVDNIAFHNNAPATAISLHYNVAVIGLLYFAFCVERIKSASEWLVMIKQTLPIAALTVAIIMTMGVILGLLAFDPVVTPLFLPFLISNLLIVCLAEEAIFRGWLQGGLTKLLNTRKHAAYIALLITALVFGIAHAKGGPWLILAAGLAGLGYGYARLKTGRIEAAMLTHFSLNGFHFVFMTYPFLNQS